MSYVALYRKYRPSRFSEVRGQDAIVRSLQNQVRSGKIGHAFLFSGTRGTGKTSLAKILARAVNCTNSQDGEPCGECPSCRAALEQRSMNIIEIDAASNNGVDNIRTIREEVAYPPADGSRYKVYIIDEVHMLSQSAYNALLKTLEEPPEYAMFILATTDVHRLAVTILSRCQRYDFRRIAPDVIRQQLRTIMDSEGIEAEDEALEYIARKADGGMRDALSIADRCTAAFLGEKLTYEGVLKVLGAVDTQVLSEMFGYIVKSDVGSVLELLHRLIGAGRDLARLNEELIGYMRNLLLFKASERSASMLEISGEDLDLVRADAASVREESLMRYIRICSALNGDMKMTDNRRILMEIALIRMCRPQMQQDEMSLKERIRRLEKMAENGVFVQTAAADQAAAGTGAEKQMEQPGEEFPEKAAPKDLQQICAMWKSILSGIESPIFRNALDDADLMFDSAEAESNTLVVVFRSFLGDRYMNDPERIHELEELISGKIRKSIRVRMMNREDTGIQKGKLQRISVVDKEIKAHIAMDVEIVSGDVED